MSAAGCARPIELLAPAGSMESLVAAVRSGADAVYLGGPYLNARRSAENFDDQTLREAVRHCHIRGVKVYLTLNTLLYDQELKGLGEALEQAVEADVDAVIVQDLAAVAFVRGCVPGLPLHASTQMSVHNLQGAAALEELGFSRVVLAREMTEEEIRQVVEKTSLDVEVFVHGALCMSVSGQCTLSCMIGGRSGNRGLCAQPCRLPFRSGTSTHALSLRDLSLVEKIPLLQEMGVRSLKIEGRMKRPEYVAGATAACRRMLEGQEVDFKTLEAVFSRTGFTDGYFAGARGSGLFGIRQKEDVTAAGPEVFKRLQVLYKDERRSVPVELTLQIIRGQATMLTASDLDGHSVTAVYDAPEEARTAPITWEKAGKLLRKTGGTPYCIAGIGGQLDEGLIVPAAKANAMRREVLDELTNRRGAPSPLPFVRDSSLAQFPPHVALSAPGLRVRLHSAPQLTDFVAEAADEIALPVAEILRLSPDRCRKMADKLLAELPRMMFDNQDTIYNKLQDVKFRGVGRALAGSLGAIHLAREVGFSVSGDFGLNITNTLALAEYQKMGLADVTLSFELERARLLALGGTLRRGILAYGYLPLMAMRACPVYAAGGGRHCEKDFPELVDRKGNRFFMDCDGQASSLHNCVPLYLADRLGEFSSADFLTLYFTREQPGRCEEILRLYRTGGPMEGEKTRGLYYRKVL